MKKISGGAGKIDLFWPGTLIVEQKSRGRSLEAAFEQADEYLTGLEPEELPRYILVSDFRNFRLRDTEAAEGEPSEFRFRLEDLKDNIGHFGFIIGAQPRRFRDDDPVNLKASRRVRNLYIRLRDSGYDRESSGRLLVRIVFCLFAEDTGIFEDLHAFENFIRERTQEDGSNLGAKLLHLFEILDTPKEKRVSTLEKDLDAFPHVNGRLFEGRLPFPSFDREMRDLLLYACEFDWSKVSPAIFGSLFQSAMDPKEQRKSGAHYTSETNILKVIDPLFMDCLRAEFQRIRDRRDGGRRRALENFQERLGSLKFLDPACGCGNFLVVAYRELRLLELEVLKELHSKAGRQALDVSMLSRIRVSQFHGIEVKAFPARIAETALWIMEHLMNRHLSDTFGRFFVSLPLSDAPHICGGDDYGYGEIHEEDKIGRKGDALEMDWNDLLPAGECDFVLGNPPYVGANQRCETQSRQMNALKEEGLVGSHLDYVTAWFFRAGHYIKAGKGRIGFVATNSITQGAQVGQLWPTLHERCGLEISFAHSTFSWKTEISGGAHVHVVIIGMVKRDDAPDSARLFSYEDPKGAPHETRHARITSYLTDGSALADPHLVVRRARQPIDLPKMVQGNAPLDDGNYTFTEKEKEAFLREEPGAEKFLRPFYMGDDFLRGKRRWLLFLHDAEPEELRALPRVRERMEKVRGFRLASSRDATRIKAEFPARYDGEVFPRGRFLVLPKVSSEHRDYLPIGWLKPHRVRGRRVPVIPGDKLFVVEEADDPLFGLLSSSMHMAWVRLVTGRLESRFSYSSEVVYNNFPPPPKWSEKKARLEPHAKAVLDAREAHPRSTLKSMYGSMPIDLRKAHRALDREVERMYRAKAFKSDYERLGCLLPLYERTSSPVVAAACPDAPRRAAKSRRRPKKG